MPRITFHDARYRSSFRDLFSDSLSEKVSWYRLWTGNAEGTAGGFVDTAAFNRFGNGWIEPNDLFSLNIDFEQFGDTHLWVMPWDGATGKWEYGQVDFFVETANDVTRKIDCDLPMDQMFADENVAEGTWYQLWVGFSDTEQGGFVDTDFLNTFGNGWVKPENLSKLTFYLSDAGKSLWVKKWTPESGDGTWRHWVVEKKIMDLPHAGVQFDTPAELDWIDNDQTFAFPHNAVGLLTVDHDLSDDLFISGTGFLISPRHVLTSAHVVLDDDGRCDADISVLFYPGLNTTREAWKDAGQVYEGIDIVCRKSFDLDTLYETWPDDDFSVIMLASPVAGADKWFVPRVNGAQDLITLEVTAAGYPGQGIDQDDPETAGKDVFQWGVYGSVSGYDYNDGVLTLSRDMTMTGGASGSPVFYSYDGQAYFTGVYAGVTNDEPVVSNIDADTYDWLMGVLTQDGWDGVSGQDPVMA